MTVDFEALAMGEKELSPGIVVTIIKIQEEGDVVFDVGDAVGSFDWGWCGASAMMIFQKKKRDRDKRKKIGEKIRV